MRSRVDGGLCCVRALTNPRALTTQPHRDHLAVTTATSQTWASSRSRTATAIPSFRGASRPTRRGRDPTKSTGPSAWTLSFRGDPFNRAHYPEGQTPSSSIGVGQRIGRWHAIFGLRWGHLRSGARKWEERRSRSDGLAKRTSFPVRDDRTGGAADDGTVEGTAYGTTDGRHTDRCAACEDPRTAWRGATGSIAAGRDVMSSAASGP